MLQLVSEQVGLSGQVVYLCYSPVCDMYVKTLSIIVLFSICRLGMKQVGEKRLLLLDIPAVEKLDIVLLHVRVQCWIVQLF